MLALLALCGYFTEVGVEEWCPVPAQRRTELGDMQPVRRAAVPKHLDGLPTWERLWASANSAWQISASPTYASNSNSCTTRAWPSPTPLWSRIFLVLPCDHALDLLHLAINCHIRQPRLEWQTWTEPTSTTRSSNVGLRLGLRTGHCSDSPDPSDPSTRNSDKATVVAGLAWTFSDCYLHSVKAAKRCCGCTARRLLCQLPVVLNHVGHSPNAVLRSVAWRTSHHPVQCSTSACKPSEPIRTIPASERLLPTRTSRASDSMLALMHWRSTRPSPIPPATSARGTISNPPKATSPKWWTPAPVLFIRNHIGSLQTRKEHDPQLALTQNKPCCQNHQKEVIRLVQTGATRVHHSANKTHHSVLKASPGTSPPLQTSINTCHSVHFWTPRQNFLLYFNQSNDYVRSDALLTRRYVLNESLHECAVAYFTRTEKDPHQYNYFSVWTTQIETSFRVK